MADDLPKFSSPPVIETVLGVQFAPLPKFSTAHAGWFWQEYLPKEWRGGSAKDAPRLEDFFERFGEEELWPMMGFQLRPGVTPNRVQIVRPEEDRMIQVQDTRFVYNWRRQGGNYPSYDTISSEFWPLFDQFTAFAAESGLGAAEFNQWEITYLNHLPKGDLWQEVADWPSIIRGLYVPAAEGRGPGAMDGFGGEWNLVLPDRRGRLNVDLRRGRPPQGGEVMVLRLTARGPVDAATGLSLADGFDIGHRAIVTTFAGMLTERADTAFGRRRS